MPPTKRKASSSVSAPKTPQTPNKSATQNKSTPKSRLLAGNLASKRKATASLNQIAGSSQKKVKTTQATKGPPKEKDSAHARNEPAEEDYASTPFTIDCPAKPPKKNDTADDVYRGTDGADLGLEVAYAVRPGRWADMKSYGTLKYNGMEFRKGSFAYFAQRLKSPEVTSEEETLASDDPLKDERENYFLAMISEAKAEGPTMVYVRVMYAYWPEELPQGRQPYHGMKEVIMSNHMDILDVHTIFSKVDVQEMDETVESVDGIYWRQTLDISKVAPGKGKQLGLLSKLRGHCRCGQPMNPDKTMYVCRYCKVWNHDHCLIDDVLERAWKKYMAGTLGKDDHEDTLREEEDSIEVAPQPKKRLPLISGIANLASRLVGASPAPTANAVRASAEIGTDTENIKESQLDGPADFKMRKTLSAKDTPKGKEKVRKPGDSAPWEGKLSATIDTNGKFGKAGLVMAQVVDEKSGEAVWTTALSCFGCERRLD